MYSSSYIGIIALFAGNFAPLGWMFCQGQLLSIAQNDALYAILGTTFGGDGVNTFALPDLRGRVPIHWGQGPGLSSYTLGQQGGTENVTVAVAQLPAHSHPFISITGNTPGATSAAGTTNDPNNAVPAMLSGETLYAGSPGTVLGPTNVNVNTGIAGGSQPFSILSPFLTINYVICTQGIFPSQN